MRRGPFLILFAVSGAAALIYEVVWTRLLTLYLGHGLAAASAVLAAFMGGLAAGAGAAGRIAARVSPAGALRLYAALEIAIGVLALLMPFALIAVQPLLAASYADGDGGPTFAFLRLAISVLLLCVPAACMGATFPIASRWMVRRASTAAQDAGALYAANTLGAAAGAILAGFGLIPALGLSGTTFVGITLNVIAAVGAYAIARRMQEASPEALATPVSSPTPAIPAPQRSRVWLAAVALGISGFASLTLQVVWTRLLVQILGPTTYAFSIVVAIFIIGIAGGAAIASRLAGRVNAGLGLASALLLSAALALAAASAVDWSLLTIADIVSRPNYEFGDVLQREILLVTGLLLPMTLAFGAAFPFALAVASGREESVTENIGLIYAINTIGAILGSLLSGFFLIPRLGLHGSIRTVAALLVTAAVAILITNAKTNRRRLGFALAAGVAIAIAMAPEWDRSLLSSGAYKYAPAMRGSNLQTALTAGELLSYREGSTATVAVRRLTGTTSLAIDGKVDASNAGDMLTQRLLAHMPLLLHPNPKRAAILGLGSGVTLGSALTHPLDEATVLEISPEVVEASKYFEAENHAALADPRTRVIVGDGRTHLMLGRQSYDVIVSEPSNPWMAGIASLFTHQFFEGARARLAPGGVLCQWAHTYDISTSDLRSIVATFLSVFPNGTLWLVGDADVLLLGSTEPLDARIAGIAAAMQRPRVATDLANVGVTRPFALTSLFVAQGEALKAWANGAPIQTDDKSQLEFSGPRSIFGVNRDDNAALLRELAAASPKPAAVSAALAAATPADWRDRGLMFLKSDANRPAYADLRKALEANPDDPTALDALARAAANLNQIQDAQAFIAQLASDPARIPAKLALSRVLASQGNVNDAIRIPFTVLQTNPGHVPALEQLASVLSDVGDTERLEPVAMRLITEAPKNAWAHYYAASLFFLQNRHDMALRAARNAVAIDPNHAKAHNLIGACLASTGQADAARTAFENSIKADPRDPGTYTNLATLELQAGNRERARRYFAEALTVDPFSQTARDGLASVTGAR
ncbi:MAG TPA: fused MFS/spermidine synthase [Vicinamibacterales bacterium]